MAQIETRQGGLGAPPNDATFWVTYDDTDMRISSMRCVNNHSSLSCRLRFMNGITGENIYVEVPPATTQSLTFRRNQEFFITDEVWGYSMTMKPPSSIRK